MIFSMPGLSTKVSCKEPSGPEVGPAMSETSIPGLEASPKTEAIVFSWAPPTISLVMTCATRIANASEAWA